MDKSSMSISSNNINSEKINIHFKFEKFFNLWYVGFIR